LAAALVFIALINANGINPVVQTIAPEPFEKIVEATFDQQGLPITQDLVFGEK
jgi:hypothetical protein